MAWLYFDWSKEPCFYMAIGLIFTETSNISSLCGISVLRLITVIKKKKNHKSGPIGRWSLEIYFSNMFTHWIGACVYNIRCGYENTAGKEMIKNPI